MRWILLALPVLFVPLFHPAHAAQPAAVTEASATPESPGTGDDNITFEQYRDWRLTFMERRRSDLAMQLASADLPARQKTRLEQTKAYYDWFAGLPDKDRDQRFRERFNRIDANHDGIIDHAERAAWHDKQSAFYHHTSAAEPRPAPASH